MSKTLLLLNLLILLIAPPVLAAEDDSEDDSAETTPSQQEPTSQEPETEIETGSLDGPGDLSVEENPQNENFIPSIRITEDLPVAFPVDI